MNRHSQQKWQVKPQRRWASKTPTIEGTDERLIGIIALLTEALSHRPSQRPGFAIIDATGPHMPEVPEGS